MRAIGGNEKAAELTGVPVVRVKIEVYVICALAAGLQGIIISGWLGMTILKIVIPRWAAADVHPEVGSMGRHHGFTLILAVLPAEPAILSA